MRIAQTSDGRYIKVITPQMQGLIGRLYQEIHERKAEDDLLNQVLTKHENQMSTLTSQIETMLVRYGEITEHLRKLFPEDEPYAALDKPLEINGSVKSTVVLSTTTSEAPIRVESSVLVEKLNVEFVGGYSLLDIQTERDQKIQELNDDITKRFGDEEEYNKANYAPIEHVNAGGSGVHPHVTYTTAGFMSPTDKETFDNMKDKLDTLELPGGMVIGATAPSSPKVMQVWIDIN